MVYNIKDRLEEVRNYMKSHGVETLVSRENLEEALTSQVLVVRTTAINNAIDTLIREKYITKTKGEWYNITKKWQKYKKPIKGKQHE